MAAAFWLLPAAYYFTAAAMAFSARSILKPAKNYGAFRPALERTLPPLLTRLTASSMWPSPPAVAVMDCAKPAATWTGRAFLEALDSQATKEAPFDPAAARDRECLDGCDFVECLCWLGSKLAEALAHAHSQGVLHRDIKPANILVSPYGRPLLADFNVAQAPAALRGTDKETFGGTLPYMAPEHLDAFTGQTDATARVDQRSDIYSFGVLGYELLAGRPPFTNAAAAKIIAAHFSETPRDVRELRPLLQRNSRLRAAGWLRL